MSERELSLQEMNLIAEFKARVRKKITAELYNVPAEHMSIRAAEYRGGVQMAINCMEEVLEEMTEDSL